MKITNFIMLFACIFFALCWCAPVYADQHKKDEVTQLINQAQTRLDAVKAGNTADLIRYEISKLEGHIASSKKFLADGKTDMAFYEISAGSLYFLMMDARVDLHNSLVELDTTKSNNSH
jgi:hypothetical protein